MEILIVDDHRLVREMLGQFLTGERIATRVLEAERGEEAVRRLRAESVQLVLMDINMPGIGGIEATRRARRSGFGGWVLALTHYDHWLYMRHAFNAGANGYLVKDVSSEQLRHAIERVKVGGRPVHPASLLQDYVTADIDSDGAADHPFARLSSREFEVVRLLMQGYQQREIASILGRSAKTIWSHRSEIHRKLQCTSDCEVLRLAVRFGLHHEAPVA